MQKIENTDLGIVAEINYSARGWVSNYYTNRVDAVSKNKDGEVKYKRGGYYTTEIIAEDTTTSEKWLAFRAPKYPENRAANYGMNALSFQINQLSDALKAKLPPTDCRLRPDLRLWEEKDGDQAEVEKERLERNQAKRRDFVMKQLKEGGRPIGQDPTSSYANSMVESEDTLAENTKQYDEFLDAMDQETSETEVNQFDQSIEKLDE